MAFTSKTAENKDIKMNSFKLLALDLDGTLTNKEKKISLKNRRYIRKAQEANVSIVLASGRPIIGIKSIADTLDLWSLGGYILAYNGGHIVDCKTGESLIKKTVSMEYVHYICDVIHRYHVYPLSYNEIGVICENDTSQYVLKEGFNNGIPIIKVDNLEAQITKPVVKFMVVGDPNELQRAYTYLKNLFDGKLNVFFSEPYFMEITPLGIEKASALAALAERLGIKQDEIIACGDGLNDIPMLEYAGLSIAMGNAYDETKAVADYVVSSNENDGVADAIKRFILGD